MQSKNTLPIIEFFQSEAEKKAPRTAAAYRQAISAFNSFLLSNPGCAISEMLPGFSVWLFLGGYSFKTSSHYLDIIVALLNKWEAGVAAEFQAVRQSLSPTLWDNAISDAPFQRLLALIKTASRQKGETSVALDFLLLALLNPQLTVEKISKLRVNDIPSLTPFSEEIVARQADPRRKFLFPLEHSYRTPRQLREYVNQLLRSLLRQRNLPVYGSLDQTIRSYRAYTALRAGIAPEEAAALAPGATPGLPVMSLFSELAKIAKVANPAKIANEPNQPNQPNLEKIAEVLLANPERWFALRLRPYISYSELTDRFAQLQKEKTFTTPELFYPREEIARRVGKKIEFEEKPVIRDVVFFKSRATDILPMLAKVGDLAWCYKTDGRHGRTYAAIPVASFRLFQETIGQFTPDYEVAPIGTLTLLPGERVEIIAGPHAGETATVTGTAKVAATVTGTAKVAATGHSNPKGAVPGILYRFEWVAGNGFEWRVDLPASKVRKLEN